MSTSIVIDNTILEQIEHMSAGNFSFKEMAIYLQLPVKVFTESAKEKDSEIWTAIQRGRLKTEFEIQDKLRLNAESGNITAAQQFDKMRRAKDVENLKQRIFYGD